MIKSALRKSVVFGKDGGRTREGAKTQRFLFECLNLK